MLENGSLDISILSIVIIGYIEVRYNGMDSMVTNTVLNNIRYNKLYVQWQVCNQY